MVISDYDKFDYDYQQYWKNRSYEHRSELMALKRLLSGVFGEFLLDIGGSYGRLVETYYDRFEAPVIIDFSLKTLQNNREVLLKKYPRLNLIAANAYSLPFKDSVFDGALMVRVLHHIQEPERYLKQLNRVMRNNGVYIQEYANKNHLKAKLKAVLRGNFKFFSQETYQQPTQGNFEGSNGEETVFLNFHPRFMKEILRNSGFKVRDSVGVSYLRVPFIKRILPETVMLLIEKLCQVLLNRTYLSPSIFVKSRLQKEHVATSSYEKLADILVCPQCKGELSISENAAQCSSCQTTYNKKKDIWDFRVK